MGKLKDFLTSANYDWDLCDFIINNSNRKNLVAKIAIEPLNRNTWYFCIFNNNDKYSVDCSYLTNEEKWRYMIGAMKQSIKDKNTPFDKAYDEVVGTKSFNNFFRNNCKVYKMKFEQEYINYALEEIFKLDFNTPKKDCHGLDGYSLHFRLEKTDKEFHTWCCSEDTYYYRIIELVNYLLICATGIIDDYFRVPHKKAIEYKYKIYDNEIFLDEEKLILQFKMKFQDRKEYKKEYDKYLKKFLNMSQKKKFKTNFNLRTSMLDNIIRTDKIIEYISNQPEEEINIFDWCGYEDNFKSTYGDEMEQ